MGKTDHFRKISIVLSIYYLISASCLFAKDNYVWPTNAGRAISSTFGEYRPGHYHSGIDIKTWNKTGYKVYAVDNGYIEKIRVSNGGYGRVIYQRLDDGFLAVYAHLERFADYLEDVVEREQSASETYRISREFRPGEFTVRKGEIIAYTGDTGTMSPHLHFEIRNPEGIPVNPLNNYNIVDKTIPLAKAIRIVPLDLDSRVDGSIFPKIYPVIYSGMRQFAPLDTIQVYGRIGFEIAAYDKIRGLPNKYGIYKISLFIDDSLQYQVAHDSISFTDSDLIKLEYSSDEFQGDNTAFQKLYLFDRNHPYPEVIKRSYGFIPELNQRHNVKIVLEDQNGNRSQVNVVLFSVENPYPGVEYSDAEKKHIQVCCNAFGKIKDCHFRFFSLQGFLLPIPEINLMENSESCLTYRIGTFRNEGFLEVRADYSEGFTSPPVYIPSGDITVPSDRAPRARISRIAQIAGAIKWKLKCNPIWPGEIKFSLGYLDTVRELPILQNNAPEMEVAPLPLPDLEDVLSTSITLSGSPEFTVREPFKPLVVTPENGGRVVSADKRCELFIEKNGVYYPLAVWISKTDKTGGGDQKIIPQSPVYSIFPEEHPLAHSAVISIRFDPLAENPDKLAIFRYNTSKNLWNYIESYVDPLLGIVSASTTDLGTFAVFQDTLSPTIEPVKPANGGIYYASDLKWIFGKLQDDESGINDSSLLIRIDGQRIFAEYHPFRKIYRYRFRNLLQEGKHSLSILAFDNKGNLSSRELTFTVKGETR